MIKVKIHNLMKLFGNSQGRYVLFSSVSISFVCLISCAEGTCTVISAHHSQGGVQFPTGGDPFREVRERLSGERVSRSGANPEPTVIVRMEEKTTKTGRGLLPLALCFRRALPCALILAYSTRRYYAPESAHPLGYSPGTRFKRSIVVTTRRRRPCRG